MNYLKTIRKFTGRKRSPWIAATVGLRGLLMVIVYKITSISFGAAGLALFSHFQNLVSLFTQVPDQGTNLGIMRLYYNGSRKRLLAQSLMLNGLILLVVLIFMGIGRYYFFEYFGQIFEMKISAFWLLPALAMILFSSISLSFYYAARAYRLLFFLTLINFLILCSAILLFRNFSVYHLMFAFFIGWGISGLVNLLAGMYFGIVPMPAWNRDGELFKQLLSFTGFALVVMLTGKLVDFFIRDFSLDWYGEEKTGYWQAQVQLAAGYRSVFLGTIGLIYYSKLGLITERLRRKTSLYVKKTLFMVFPMLLLGLGLIFLFREQIILLLYHSSLLPSAAFIHWQLMADLMALPGILLIYAILLQKRFSALIWLHLFSAALYLIFILWLSGWLGYTIESLPMANFYRQIVFLGILLFLYFYRWDP